MSLVSSSAPWAGDIQPVRVIAAPFADEADPTSGPPPSTAWVPRFDPGRGLVTLKVLVFLGLVDADERRVFGGTAETITAYAFVPPTKLGLGKTRPEAAFVLASYGTAINPASLDLVLELDVVPGTKIVLRLEGVANTGTATSLNIAMMDVNP